MWLLLVPLVVAAVAVALAVAGVPGWIGAVVVGAGVALGFRIDRRTGCE